MLPVYRASKMPQLGTGLQQVERHDQSILIFGDDRYQVASSVHTPEVPAHTVKAMGILISPHAA
jgi:hypothetical protein